LPERAGRTELLVPAARFQREYPDHVGMMRELRGAELARTEGGEQPKLTVKAPSANCRKGCALADVQAASARRI
jgi:hypothetical protein